MIVLNAMLPLVMLTTDNAVTLHPIRRGRYSYSLKLGMVYRSNEFLRQTPDPVDLILTHQKLQRSRLMQIPWPPAFIIVPTPLSSHPYCPPRLPLLDQSNSQSPKQRPKRTATGHIQRKAPPAEHQVRTTAPQLCTKQVQPSHSTQ